MLTVLLLNKIVLKNVTEVLSYCITLQNINSDKAFSKKKKQIKCWMVGVKIPVHV